MFSSGKSAQVAANSRNLANEVCWQARKEILLVCPIYCKARTNFGLVSLAEGERASLLFVCFL